MTVNDAGQLVMEEDGVKLIFAKTDAASIELETPVVPEEPAGDNAAVMDDRMEIKYICTSADVEGLTMQPSILGGEYSLTFHADGTVDFVMVGTPINGLPWTQDGSTIRIDYYGTIMDTTVTEEGFDLNYFDAMMLHLFPEA